MPPRSEIAVASGVYNATLEAWSGGYVEFLWNPKSRALTPWVSADGLTWSSGSTIDISVWNSWFKSYDRGLNAAERADCVFEVIQFQEGPDSLLIRGQVDCGRMCGATSPGLTPETMWSSSDAKSWTPIDMPSVFGAGGIGPISGGSSGFVALGTAYLKQSIWTSSDGRNWQLGALPAPALTTGSWAYDPVSFAGGYVLPGTILKSKGREFFPYQGPFLGCGVVEPDTSIYQVALWWSPDGTTWSPEDLSGTRAGPSTISMNVYRIDDHMLVAQEWSPDTGSGFLASWVSTDGKTWNLVKGFPQLFLQPILAGRSCGLGWGWAASDNSSLTLIAQDDKLKLVTLKQIGDLPWWDNPYVALGPTGLLATDDGSRFWIGVPTAG